MELKLIILFLRRKNYHSSLSPTFLYFMNKKSILRFNSYLFYIQLNIQMQSGKWHAMCQMKWLKLLRLICQNYQMIQGK